MNPDPATPLARTPPPRGRAAGWAVVVLLLAGLQATPARADIWGYTDAQGMPHFSSFQVDERYEIFLRDRSEPEPYTVQPYRKSAQAPAEAQVAAPTPRMLVSFEELPSYKAVHPLLVEASTTHGIDYALLQALIATESGFNSRAVSPKGAVGLMQLIPPTAERYGVRAGNNASVEKKLTDPVINIRAGARYLSDLIKMFPGRLELALAAYNAGEGAVQRAGNRIPNYPETKNYVKTVMQLYGYLKPPVGATAPAPGSAASGRVRAELGGVGPGRGNLPTPAQPPAEPPQARAGQD